MTPDLRPGTIVDGKYQLDVPLGAGGFGVVFAATHLGLRRRVALKLLTRTDPTGAFFTRFRAEAEAPPRSPRRSARSAEPGQLAPFALARDQVDRDPLFATRQRHRPGRSGPGHAGAAFVSALRRQSSQDRYASLLFESLGSPRLTKAATSVLVASIP